MKAAIGILLVFTGLTVGYLVLAGKLPMTVPTLPIPNPQNTTVPTVPGTPKSTVPIGITYTPHIGGGLVASVPDTYVQGQIKAGRYAL